VQEPPRDLHHVLPLDNMLARDKVSPGRGRVGCVAGLASGAGTGAGAGAGKASVGVRNLMVQRA